MIRLRADGVGVGISSAVARRGLTLIEMMVALAITLLMMGAVINLFGSVGRNVSESRATVEMSQKLRSAAQRLRNDLRGLIPAVNPVQRPEANSGYFEIYEGPLRDSRKTATTDLPTDLDDGVLDDSTILGDWDDILVMTVRSLDDPFVGKFTPPLPPAAQTLTTESPIAEVAWFCRQGLGPYRTLYRRTLLVQPRPAAPWDPNTGSVAAGATFAGYYDLYDISARFDSGSSRFFANTLEDLTRREFRFGHRSVAPVAPAGLFHFNPSNFTAFPDPANPPPNSPRFGDDVILTDVLGFDIKVWDPTAPIYAAPDGIPLTPNDQGYIAAATAATPTIVSYGAYVDLNYRNQTGPPSTWTSKFSGQGSPKYLSVTPPYPASPANPVVAPAALYDTWSLHYEFDNDDTDGDTAVDEGANGRDDDGAGGVDGGDNFDNTDDPDEPETSPPYPYPLRGIQIRVRCYEPDARQVREVTIVHDFVPQ